jgi:D-aminopeptidase
MGLARTGGIASNGSGDYVIAFSTHADCRIPHRPGTAVRSVPVLHDEHVSPLFLAAIEAAEEAIVSSLFCATTMSGYGGRTVEALPVDRILPLLTGAIRGAS